MKQRDGGSVAFIVLVACFIWYMLLEHDALREIAEG